MRSVVNALERRLDRLAACANIAATLESGLYLSVALTDWTTCLPSQSESVMEVAAAPGQPEPRIGASVKKSADEC
jgi:hypothetical protein